MKSLSRRRFIKRTAGVVGMAAFSDHFLGAGQLLGASPEQLLNDLPAGNAPQPVARLHFPDRLHAFVWRNWQLVPINRMAQVVGAKPAEILELGKAMGLSEPPRITANHQRRSYITVIKRNWHLLPYDQLLQLLEWAPGKMAYSLREDDMLFLKLGAHKPQCEPLKWAGSGTLFAQAHEMARVVREEFPRGVGSPVDPLFGFISRLSSKPVRQARAGDHPSKFSIRFCYSYFALYGDPLLDKMADPYPEGYLARLADSGVNGLWLPGLFARLAPFAWDPALSARRQERLARLRALAKRAQQYGIGLYLYVNEPRSLPVSFFDAHPELKGVMGKDGYAALCSSNAEVQQYLLDSACSICHAVPELAGFFTITGSEYLTNCWSHGGGAECPRCGQRSAAEVIAEVNRLIHQGMAKAGSKAKLIVWDWGWANDWTEGIINRLPEDVYLMSVSEWDIPIQRGGVTSTVGEYCISAIGPGPRARRHWELARKRGLKTIAKIQANNTWELSAVPYIPAVWNVAKHAANLRQAGVDGLMLGWTLGGCPSPNLEIVAEIGKSSEPLQPEEAMKRVASRRFGNHLAPAVVKAWSQFSAAFSEFPFHISLVYLAPMQLGPANPFWGEPTGYEATMVGFPYDDLDRWRVSYPPEVFIAQFDKIADGFEEATATLRESIRTNDAKLFPQQRQALADELNVAEAAAIHFRSTANQARFVAARRALAAAKNKSEALPLCRSIEKILKNEIILARRLYTIQSQDSRIGFEAANQYFYVPLDLVEKVLNCRDLLERWLPASGTHFM